MICGGGTWRGGGDGDSCLTMKFSFLKSQGFSRHWSSSWWGW